MAKQAGETMKQEDSGVSSGIPLVKPPLGMPKEGVLRPGRGFSYGEIEKAGASVDGVRMARLRIDPLRKSVHDVNVKTLQELLGTRGKGKVTQKSKAKAALTRKKEEKKGKAKGSSGKK